MKSPCISAEDLAAHNTHKIKSLYEAGDISDEGAISFLMMLCDIEEDIAEYIVTRWNALLNGCDHVN